eukprot:CAMPEP_0198287308 /NCGR_PEP_ID=MMETSP1449-20131203/6185_1 /TAXON_ID=420275 /ORGANISM="Attheya septentrionalis, Strain CCMP2084" /LENGTH=315 /DNA_ID=CAMNT_0043985253 /DNA_START=21 /DNA_END=968 /DNA_ORIENTATION=-
MTEERSQTMEACPPPPLTISYDTHLKILEKEKEQHKALRVNSKKRHESMCAKLQNEITQLKVSLKQAKETVSSQGKELPKVARELKKTKKALKLAEDSIPPKKRGRRSVAEMELAKKARLMESADGGEAIPTKPNKHEIRWNEKVEQLVRFKEQFGHCNVTCKRHGRSSEDEEYVPLGVWVTDQRTMHRFLRQGKPSSMTPDRIRQLDSIGFQWTALKTQPLTFEERFEQLKEYNEAHGHLNVPQKCKDSPVGLGNFVLDQRRMYKSVMSGQAAKNVKKLSEEEVLARIQQLTDIGFEWSLRNRGQGGGGSQTFL